MLFNKVYRKLREYFDSINNNNIPVSLHNQETKNSNSNPNNNNNYNYITLFKIVKELMEKYTYISSGILIINQIKWVTLLYSYTN